MIRGGGYFFYVIGSSVMMLLGGPLADRLGRVRLLSIFTIAAVVILYTIMLIPTQAWGVYGVLLFLAGGFCGATNPMGVAIGQRLAPECASTISGILMGLAWAVASPVFWLIGILAERSGVVPALRWVGSLGFLGILAVSAFILLNRRLKIAA
jgi:MFS family permease